MSSFSKTVFIVTILINSFLLNLPNPTISSESSYNPVQSKFAGMSL
ncbi:hypothetical protein [Winogradskyella sp.]